MGNIDRAKALQNLAFGEDGGAYIPVTTLHTSGAMTSGGHAGVATTSDVFDLQLPEETGVSTDGLARLLRNVDDDMPELTLDGNLLHVKSKHSDYAIGTTDAVLQAAPSSFPGTNELDATDTSVLRTLKMFHKQASKDLSRAQLQSVFFSERGITATDGYCIADWEVPLAGLSGGFSVPAVSIATATKIFIDGFKMRLSETKTAFYDDETRWIVPNHESPFKPYQEYIPADSEFKTAITFDKRLPEIISAVANATAAENVYLEFAKDEIQVYAAGENSCRAQEIYPVQNELLHTIKFRAKWAVQAMKNGLAIYDSPTLNVVSDKRPAVISALNNRFAFSPMDTK